MPVIRETLTIAAPRERCFDLARSVQVHVESTSRTGETAVAGVTTGLMNLGDEVTWRARHLGIVQHLSSRITAFDRPHYFRDTMVRGAFRRFDHDHLFEPGAGGTTIMTDVFDFSAPFGIIGRLAEWAFLTRYMRRLLVDRNLAIKRIAEGEEWQKYLNNA